jgi:hypothetical protein
MSSALFAYMTGYLDKQAATDEIAQEHPGILGQSAAIGTVGAGVGGLGGGALAASDRVKDLAKLNAVGTDIADLSKYSEPGPMNQIRKTLSHWRKHMPPTGIAEDLDSVRKARAAITAPGATIGAKGLANDAIKYVSVRRLKGAGRGALIGGAALLALNLARRGVNAVLD